MPNFWMGLLQSLLRFVLVLALGLVLNACWVVAAVYSVRAYIALLTPFTPVGGLIDMFCVVLITLTLLFAILVMIFLFVFTTRTTLNSLTE